MGRLAGGAVAPHVTHSLMLFEVVPNVGAGFASGGFLADSLVDGDILAGGQQQWFTRNVQAKAWKGGTWTRSSLEWKARPPRAVVMGWQHHQ